MNEIPKLSPKRGRDRKPGAADMSWVDRLEPLDADAQAAALERPCDFIPPGYYTPETLPPLSEKARKILASVAVGVARLRAERPAEPVEGEAGIGCAGEGRPGIALSDEGQPGIALSDEGLRGIDPGP